MHSLTINMSCSSLGRVGETSLTSDFSLTMERVELCIQNDGFSGGWLKNKFVSSVLEYWQDILLCRCLAITENKRWLDGILLFQRTTDVADWGWYDFVASYWGQSKGVEWRRVEHASNILGFLWTSGGPGFYFAWLGTLTWPIYPKNSGTAENKRELGSLWQLQRNCRNVDRPEGAKYYDCLKKETGKFL